jgi:hypothetical protein
MKKTIINDIETNLNFEKRKTFDNGLRLFRMLDNNAILHSMIVNKENKIIGYTITRHEKGLINWAKNV